jgi:hypothetical protein
MPEVLNSTVDYPGIPASTEQKARRTELSSVGIKLVSEGFWHVRSQRASARYRNSAASDGAGQGLCFFVGGNDRYEAALSLKGGLRHWGLSLQECISRLLAFDLHDACALNGSIPGHDLISRSPGIGAVKELLVVVQREAHQRNRLPHQE